MDAGQTTVVAITDVRLATSGGPTTFGITTYYDSDKKDEKLSFTDGFRLPGRILSIRNPYLYSEYQKDELQYPVGKIIVIFLPQPFTRPLTYLMIRSTIELNIVSIHLGCIKRSTTTSLNLKLLERSIYTRQ